MSCSLPIQGAQLPVLCKFCERSSERIEWKCLDCDLFMCTVCKNKIHPKFKSADQHRVVQLKNIGLAPNSEVWNFELFDVKEYSTQLYSITSITVTVSEDYSLWLSDKVDNEKGSVFFSSLTKLQKIKLESGIATLDTIVKLNKDISVYDVAVMPCGDVIVATGEHSLQQVNMGTNKLTDSKYSVYPNKATSVHINEEKKILIGAIGRDTGISQGMVIVMDIYGFYLDMFRYDHDGTPLFEFPFRVRHTKRGRILVLNRNDSEKRNGNLIALNSVGDVIFTYSGGSNKNEQKQFEPTDLSVSPSENIVIIDVKNKLHILSSKGQILKYFETTNLGIVCPFSVAISTVGKVCELYIGCVSNDNSKKGKLYKMILKERKS